MITAELMGETLIVEKTSLQEDISSYSSPCLPSFSFCSSPEGVCLNVNIPAHCTPEGIKVTEAAPGYWTEEYKEYADPSGRPFYMLTGRFVNTEPENPATDLYWLERNFVTVTPVRPDLTDRRAIEDIDRLLADA